MIIKCLRISFSKNNKLPQHFSSINTCLQHVLATSENPLHCQLKTAIDPLATSIPFPHIFAKNVTSYGYINRDDQRNGPVISTPTMALLSQDKSMKKGLESIMSSVSKLDVNTLPKLVEAGVDRELWKEILEEFTNVVEVYGVIDR